MNYYRHVAKLKEKMVLADEMHQDIIEVLREAVHAARNAQHCAGEDNAARLATFIDAANNLCVALEMAWNEDALQAAQDIDEKENDHECD